jgi:hypothetical protein
MRPNTGPASLFTLLTFYRDFIILNFILNYFFYDYNFFLSISRIIKSKLLIKIKLKNKGLE